MSPARDKAWMVLDAGESEALCGHLVGALRDAGVDARSLEVVAGRSALRPGSFPNETLRCQLADGGERLLFLKYSRNGAAESGPHRRAGISGEAEVYRRLLVPFSGSSARFVAAGEIPPLGVSYLLLEELEDVLRVSKTPPANMLRAAEWIGRFHLANERGEGRERTMFLATHDREYYLHWCRRALELTTPLHADHRWLPSFGERFERELVPALLAAPQTVVHGEFYPINILTRGVTIYPVDWESAAVAAGELDVASLTDGWPPDVIEACVDSYCRSRWPAGEPAHFRAALAAARVYFIFRWLGNGPYFASGEHARRRLSELRAMGDTSSGRAREESSP